MLANIPWIHVGVLAALLVVGLITMRVLKDCYPSAQPAYLFNWLLTCADFVTDALFLAAMRDTQWAFAVALTIFVVSWCAHVYMVRRLFRSIMSAPGMVQWIDDNLAWASLVVLLSFSNPESLLVLRCHLFGLHMFHAPLTAAHEHSLKSSTRVTLVLETVPQLALQIVVLSQGDVSPVVYLALCVSVFQIGMGSVRQALLRVVGKSRSERSLGAEPEEAEEDISAGGDNDEQLHSVKLETVAGMSSSASLVHQQPTDL